MSGTKVSVKRERDPKLVKVTKEKKVQFLSCIVLKKRLKIFNSWNISFASGKPNVESRKQQNKVNYSLGFGSIRLQAQDDEIVK